MKKITGLFPIIVLFTVIGCTNNKPAEVKKEVIVVPVTPVTVPEKNTTIILDKDKVKVTTRKVDVTVIPPKKKNK